MAERRMFSKIITDSDLFLDMPATAQLLYFHLGMCGDDEGFVNNPKKIQRSIGCTDDDLKLLIAKGFVIPFESGVIVITHWHVHNTLRKDRLKRTVFEDERQQLTISDNGAYCLIDNQMTTNCQPSDNQMTTKCTPNIREDNIREDKREKAHAPSKPIRHKYGEYKNVLLSDEEMEKLRSEFPFDYNERIDRLSEYMRSTGKNYKDHLATIRSWARRDKEKLKSPEKPKSEFFNADILEVFADE